MLGYAKKAEAMKLTLEKKSEKEKLDILDVVALKDDIQSFLGIAKDVLSMLYTELISDEEQLTVYCQQKIILGRKTATCDERLKKVN